MCSKEIFSLILFCISYVLCNHKLCDLNDNNCMTRSASRQYVDVISGMPGVETSDPLHLDFFEANLPKLKYRIMDGSLSGLKNCQLEVVHFASKEKKYYVYYECPHLIFESRYQINGYVGPEFVEGKGTCQVDYYDYNLLFEGDYDKVVLEDGKSHLHFKNNKLDIDAKGKIHYDLKNLFNGDKVKSDAIHKFANENWQFVDKLTRQKPMELFMTKHIENVNDYFRKYAIEDLFTY